MNKKLFTMFLAASMALSLTACGGGSDTTTVDEEEDLETTIAVSDETTSDAGSGSGGRSSTSNSTTSGSSRSDSDSGFEEYLKENDPESYEYYQDLEEGWESGEWDSENGFSGGDSGFE